MTDAEWLDLDALETDYRKWVDLGNGPSRTMPVQLGEMKHLIRLARKGLAAEELVPHLSLVSMATYHYRNRLEKKEIQQLTPDGTAMAFHEAACAVDELREALAAYEAATKED